MSQKIRLDLHMLTKGLASSRQQAQKLIRAGKVRDLNGQLFDKPGQEVPNTLELQVKNQPRFVSRGGEKLLAGLEKFSLNIKSSRPQGVVCFRWCCPSQLLCSALPYKASFFGRWGFPKQI